LPVRTFPAAVRRSKDPCKEITNPRDEVGRLAIDIAGGVLEIADGVLGRTFDLVGLAAPFQLGVAGRLVDGLLDLSRHAHPSIR